MPAYVFRTTILLAEKKGCPTFIWAQRVPITRKPRGGGPKNERGALHRRDCGRGGLAELQTAYLTSTLSTRVSLPSALAPADSPSTEQFTVSDVAFEYEINPCGSVDDEADGQLDADDVGGS